MSPPRLGQADWGRIPSGFLCSIPWFGGCESLGLTRERQTIMGDETRGKRKG